jgi:hypothetical protein
MVKIITHIAAIKNITAIISNVKNDICIDVDNIVFNVILSLFN